VGCLSLAAHNCARLGSGEGRKKEGGGGARGEAVVASRRRALLLADLPSESLHVLRAPFKKKRGGGAKGKGGKERIVGWPRNARITLSSRRVEKSFPQNGEGEGEREGGGDAKLTSSTRLDDHGACAAEKKEREKEKKKKRPCSFPDGLRGKKKEGRGRGIGDCAWTLVSV